MIIIIIKLIKIQAQLIQRMFRNVFKLMQRATPLISALPLLVLPSIKLAENATTPTSEILNIPSKLEGTQFVGQKGKITEIGNFDEFIEKNPEKGQVLILFEMQKDERVNAEAKRIAHHFLEKCEKHLRTTVEFVFITYDEAYEGNSGDYFAVFSAANSGGKMINIEDYLKNGVNHKDRALNYQKLFNRLLQSINQYKEITINNLHEELEHMDMKENPYTLAVFAGERAVDLRQAREQMKKLFSQNQILRRINKVIVMDEHSKRILGLPKKDSFRSVYLIAPVNENLQESEHKKYYMIDGKKYVIFDALYENCSDKFVFPVLSKKKEDNLVLGVTIDQNQDVEEITNRIYEQFAKEELKDIPKRIYHGNQDQKVLITLFKPNHIDEATQAYKVKTPFTKEQTKQLLTHSYEWKYPLKEADLLEEINAKKIKEWVEKVKKNPNENQFYKTEKEEPIFHSQEIVGQEYVSINKLPEDKVIFHYSQHCHGCKKFAGQYEQIASQYRKQISFYRINNDNNKSEGMKNYDSTPVFVFYKNGLPQYPFVYKMSYFTKPLFESFLKITKQVKVMPLEFLDSHFADRKKGEHFIKEMLDVR